MLNARPDTIEKAIDRTLNHRTALQTRVEKGRGNYHTKASPRQIDIRRETEILGKLMELRNVRK